MVSKKIKLVNEQGLHMRPADILANAMIPYECDVVLKTGGKEINAKSIMNLIAAGLKCGDEAELICTGKDEEKALSEAVSLIESGFGETEGGGQ